MLFLYSTPNVVGCVLAMGGLGLFFVGLIHAYWWAIVAGLYGAGVAGWPRNTLAETAETAELSTELLAQQVRKLVDSVAKGLPKEAVDELREIESTLNELLPRLQQMQDRGTISAKDSFTVVETVRRYLPDTLGAYLRLPKLYAQVQTLGDRQTASQLLTSQLRMLKASLQEVARNAFAGDAEKLVTNGKFLEAKFSEVTAFRP
jgi:type I site-specific restriction endonuclease